MANKDETVTQEKAPVQTTGEMLRHGVIGFAKEGLGFVTGTLSFLNPLSLSEVVNYAATGKKPENLGSPDRYKTAILNRAEKIGNGLGLSAPEVKNETDAETQEAGGDIADGALLAAGGLTLLGAGKNLLKRIPYVSKAVRAYELGSKLLPKIFSKEVKQVQTVEKKIIDNTANFRKTERAVETGAAESKIINPATGKPFRVETKPAAETVTPQSRPAARERTAPQEKPISEVYQEAKIKSAATGGRHAIVGALETAGHMAEKIPLVGRFLKPALHATAEGVRIGVPVVTTGAVTAVGAHVATDGESTKILTRKTNHGLDNIADELAKTNPELARKVRALAPDAAHILKVAASASLDMVETAVLETAEMRGISMDKKDAHALALAAQGKQAQAAIAKSEINSDLPSSVAQPIVIAQNTHIQPTATEPGQNPVSPESITVPSTPAPQEESAGRLAALRGKAQDVQNKTVDLIQENAGTITDSPLIAQGTEKAKEAEREIKETLSREKQQLEEEKIKFDQQMREQQKTMLARLHEKEETLASEYEAKKKDLEEKARQKTGEIKERAANTLHEGKEYLHDKKNQIVEAGITSGLSTVFHKAGEYMEKEWGIGATGITIGAGALLGTAIGGFFNNKMMGLLVGIMAGIVWAAYGNDIKAGASSTASKGLSSVMSWMGMEEEDKPGQPRPQAGFTPAPAPG